MSVNKSGRWAEHWESVPASKPEGPGKGFWLITMSMGIMQYVCLMLS